MKKIFLMLVVVVALFCFADNAFAADGLASFGKGLGAGLAIIGAGIGLGYIGSGMQKAWLVNLKWLTILETPVSSSQHCLKV